MGDTSTYKAKSGKVLTGADIEAMADEAERGYDVDSLLGRSRRRGRPTIGDAPSEVVPVRLDRLSATPSRLEHRRIIEQDGDAWGAYVPDPSGLRRRRGRP
ncbi:MAG TPA: hypothetical protein VKU88_06215 [Acidimicrobiales bacterium]|nr:hypothetical protein [Acidimicrobiales bacterium]